MAIRYGGRYELEGSVQVLIFPAEDAQEKKEIKELRKELEAAKAQGEAYARELAAVFADPAGASSRPPPISASAPPLESAFGFLGPLARVSDAVADDLRAMLSPLGAAKIKMRNLESETAGADSAAMLGLVEKVNDALTKGAELLALMRQLARTGGDIDRIPVDLAAIARDEANAATIAFASRGVVLSISIEGELMLQGMPSALRALVAEMLDRALRTSEPGGEVRIVLSGRSLLVEGVGETSRDAARSLREGGRSALVFLTEIARAHRIELRVTDASLVATVPEIAEGEMYGG
jgi:signal transduction histidine kinase